MNVGLGAVAHTYNLAIQGAGIRRIMVKPSWEKSYWDPISTK
jgi:hypothetical protein